MDTYCMHVDAYSWRQSEAEEQLHSVIVLAVCKKLLQHHVKTCECLVSFKTDIKRTKNILSLSNLENTYTHAHTKIKTIMPGKDLQKINSKSLSLSKA